MTEHGRLSHAFRAVCENCSSIQLVEKMFQPLHSLSKTQVYLLAVAVHVVKMDIVTEEVCFDSFED